MQDADIGLLVLGDGSARRTVKAPGYYDERAAAFDATVSEALTTGDPAALAAVDADLGRELLAAGVPAWHAAADLVTAPVTSARVAYDDAPLGVGYLVASWHCGG